MAMQEVSYTIMMSVVGSLPPILQLMHVAGRSLPHESAD